MWHREKGTFVRTVEIPMMNQWLFALSVDFRQKMCIRDRDGRVSYRVHEGTQPGDIFKLRGKGIPNINGRGRGDQFVRVTVEVPKNLSQQQKDLLKQFDELGGDRNYQKRKSFFDKLKDMFGDEK